MFFFHVNLPLIFEFLCKTHSIVFGKQVKISTEWLLKSIVFPLNLFTTASLYLKRKVCELCVVSLHIGARRAVFMFP